MCFNSRTPGGVRRRQPNITEEGRAVSIHAPREGCDPYKVKVMHRIRVSIHAPREGCDLNPYLLEIVALVFQFTHPGRGATSTTEHHRRRSSSFNSRTPGGVRPIRPISEAISAAVSIHAPREGCDPVDSMMCPNAGSVSIHAPREGCDLGGRRLYHDARVSIHAPREGCDLSFAAPRS